MKTTSALGYAGVFGLSLLFCATGVAAAHVRKPGPLPNHLYVTEGIGSFGAIQRYPIVNGLPASNPDLTIPGSYAELAASDLHDGHSILYALTSDIAGIDAFDYGQTVPQRRILFPKASKSNSWGVYGLAADADGYLYVTLTKQGSELGSIPFDASPDLPEQGVYIYGPNQSGQVKPEVVIPIPFLDFPIDTIAVDRSGTLYVLANRSIPGMGRCRKYANARSNPTFSGKFSSAMFGTSAGAAVNGKYIYITNFNYNTDNFDVDVFNMSDRGRVRPISSFTSTQEPTSGPVAYYAGILYIGTYAPNSIGLFNANGTGSQPPIETLSTLGNPAIDFLR